MNLFKKLKAQIALEALIIIGIFIIGVVIFATFYFQSITPKDRVDLEFGSDRVFNKTPDSPLVIIGDPDPGDPEDPEIPEVHTFSDLVLILDPESSSLVNQDFNIIAQVNSNYDSANVNLIEVKKYDEITSSFVNPTNSCELNGVYADSFVNAGTLDPSGTNKLSKTFTFSCNSSGKYDFLFTVYNENEIVPLVKNLEQSGYTDGKEIEVGGSCPGPLGTPQFSPVGGTYIDPQNINLSYTDPNCSDFNIHYTLNGTEPNLFSSIYSTEIPLAVTKTIKAKVFAKNALGQDINGDINSQTYEINSVSPTLLFTPSGGLFHTDSRNLKTYILIKVNLNYTGTGQNGTDYNIYYTTNGSDPTITSLRYISSISIVPNLSSPIILKTMVVTKDSFGNLVYGDINSQTYIAYNCFYEPGVGFLTISVNPPNYNLKIANKENIFLTINQSYRNTLCSDYKIKYHFQDQGDLEYTGPINLPNNELSALEYVLTAKKANGNQVSNKEKVQIYSVSDFYSGGSQYLGLQVWGRWQDKIYARVFPYYNLLNIGDLSLSYHTCALLSNGTIKCWGRNNYGQLGNGTASNNINFPVIVSGINNAISVSSGYAHTCALLSNGTIKCWGSNCVGQLGNGTQIDSNLPVIVSGINNAISVSVGFGHTCALLSNGTIKCWGANGSGELGNGTQIDSNLPVIVSGINNATAISVNAWAACALLSNGTIKCWGANNNGLIGNGTNWNNVTIPEFVSGINNAISISRGIGHTCALLSNGTIKCWGANGSGECGFYNGDFQNLTPVNVTDIDNAIQISAGSNYTCATLSDGTIKCWGSNYHGASITLFGYTDSQPKTIPGIANAIKVSTGNMSTCAILSDGTINCWGDNSYGQLGYDVSGKLILGYNPFSFGNRFLNTNSFESIIKIDGSNNWFSTYPSNLCILYNNNELYCNLVNGGVNPIYESYNDVLDFSSSSWHVCFILTTGNVKCWGHNNYGQLGNGNTTSNDYPVDVLEINNAIEIATTSAASCTLLTTGEIKCWGSNYVGQLGNGTLIDSNIPVNVLNINNATKLVSGSSSFCALLSDGKVKCWGDNSIGQLGDGSDIDDQSEECESFNRWSYGCSVPQFVVGINNATDIVYNGYFGCALLEDETIKCWGQNNFGQLGNGTNSINTSASLPTYVCLSGSGASCVPLTNVLDVQVKNNYACAIVGSQKNVWCWGKNNSGTLGQGHSKDYFITNPKVVEGTSDINKIILTPEMVFAVTN